MVGWFWHPDNFPAAALMWTEDGEQLGLGDLPGGSANRDGWPEPKPA